MRKEGEERERAFECEGGWSDGGDQGKKRTTMCAKRESEKNVLPFSFLVGGDESRRCIRHLRVKSVNFEKDTLSKFQNFKKKAS